MEPICVAHIPNIPLIVNAAKWNLAIITVFWTPVVLCTEIVSYWISMVISPVILARSTFLPCQLSTQWRTQDFFNGLLHMKRDGSSFSTKDAKQPRTSLLFFQRVLFNTQNNPPVYAAVSTHDGPEYCGAYVLKHLEQRL